MIKKIILGLITLLLLNPVFSQQEPQFSQNIFNILPFNPGFAGSSEAICANAIHRQQWMGFDGAPVTTAFNAHAPINLFGIPSGVGLTIIDDRIGYQKNFGLRLAYSYRMLMSGGQLGIGLNAGLLNIGMEGLKNWNSPNMIEKGIAVGSGDPMDSRIPPDQSSIGFDLGFGLFYKTDDKKLYAGIGSTHLIPSEIKFSDNASSKMAGHYFVTAGYNYELPNPLFEIKPSVFIKTDNAMVSIFDINVLVAYQKKFWGGISYRYKDAVIPMLGVEFTNGLKVGLAYDIGTSKLNKYHNGTVEAMIGYCFNITIDKTRGSYGSVIYL